MPSHLYKTRRVPPRWVDIILAHAVELVVALFCAVSGLSVIFSEPQFGQFSTTALPSLPTHLARTIGVFFALGGGLALAGLLIRRNNVRAELNVEQAGWIALAVGWITYCWASIYYTDGALMSYLFAGFTALGALLRTIALIATEHELDAAITPKGGETGTAEGGPDGKR